MNGEARHIKILHVDDEPDFLEVAKVFLGRENEDFSIETANSAEEGLERLKGNEFDVVLSDYQMPGIDGLEFLQRIRDSGNTIPFIIFTGKGREEVAMEALNKGANHYIQKGGDIKSQYGTLAHVIQETVEKRRADYKLAGIEKEHQIILDSLPLNIFHINRNSEFIHVNKALANRYEKNPEDFTGKSSKELFPLEGDSFIKSDREVLESGESQIGKVRKISTPEGDKWVRLDKVPLKDADGNVTGIIGFELDITERQVAEDRINHLNAVLRAIRDVNELITREKDRERLLQSICKKLIKTRGYYNAWIALTDSSGNFISAAQAGFGEEFVPIVDKLKRGELLNCVRRTLAQPEIIVTENPSETCADCPLASRYEGRSAMAIRLEHRGRVFGILEVSIPPQMAQDEEERVLFEEVADDIAFALHDIETEEAHKVLAEALWEVKERYRILFESAKDGIFIEDLDGQIVDVNQTACEMLGYTADELTTLSTSDIVAPEVSVQQSNFIKEIQEKGYAFARVDNVRKDKSLISTEINASIIALQDAPLVVVIARDITDRKQMEEHITRLNAMLRTLRTISELIVREKDRGELLRGICENLIETEGYHNAWIALVDAPGNFVSAAAGVNKELLAAIDKLKRGELMNCARTSLAQSGIIVTENPSEACSDCPLAGICKDGSKMSIRLEYGGKVYGVLVTSVSSRVASDEEEQVLFKELADDIAFALHDFVIEAARQRAVDALLDSEEKYRTMVEYTGTGVAILEEDDTISFVNKEFEQITGYTKEGVEGTNWTQYIVNEDLDVMKQSSKAPSGSEIRLITHGGEIKDILLYETAIPGTKKSLASLIDITQRKEAEEHLAHLYDTRRSMHEINTLITREKNRDRMITGVCKELLKTRGYHNAWIALRDDSGTFVSAKQAGLSGKEFSKVNTKVKRGELVNCARLSLEQPGLRVIENPPEACGDCPLRNSCNGGSGMTIRLEHRGNIYGILTVAVPAERVKDAEEQALLNEVADDIAFALYDIETEAAHTVLAEALWEVKERYRILFESAKEGIFIEDLDGGIVDANHTACEMLGYSYDELTNLRVCDIVAPGDAVPQTKFVKQIQEKGYAFAQGRNVRKDGTQISVEISASTITMEDKPLVVVITHDITDRQQMEEHITRLNAMLRTLRNISELIVREKDRNQLISVTCEKLIETEGYENAWIALMDAPGNFESAAQAGLGEEFSAVIDTLKRGELMNCAKKTLAESGIHVVENPSKACSDCPMVSHCNGKSGMSTRLEYGGKVYGILVTSVASRVATDEEEQVLFKELADDIAFALHDFVIEAARQRAVDALLDSEEKYRTMVEYTGTGVAILEEDGTISFVNKELERLSGYTKEEVDGTNWTNYLVKEDLEEMQTSSEPPSGSEIRLITKSGRIKDVLLNVTTIPGTQKSLASLIDITKRMQIEEALQDSEREHQTILDSVPVGLFHLDAQSRFVRVNKALAAGYGMTPDEFQGKTSKELFPELGEEYIKSDKEVLETGKPQGRDIKRIKTAEGDKWVRLDKVPLKDADGNVIGIIGFELDITSRIQAQEELRNAHKELQDIIEFLPDATFVIDRDGKVIAWNRAMEELTKIPKDDIIGEGDYTYAIPFYGVARPVLIDFVSSKTPEIEHNYEYINREGNTYYAESFAPFVHNGKGAQLWLTGTPLFDSEGTIVGAIESIRDITERKRGEEEREHFLKELEAKNTEMERFTYTVSHDLRSPLFAIQGFTTLAREDLEQGKLENLASDLERTGNAALKMDHLLNDTLQLSRVGRVANPPEDVPFKKIVEGALELVTAQIKKNGVDVALAKDFPTVHVDRVRIEEMLMNLIGNSIKYMGDQTTPKIEIGYRVDTGKTIFFVKDNGMGIDPSLHEQVFELFYKVHKTSEGTGAGLAIVKRIIEVHGGRIWIESEKGMGCTVCFTLPCSK